MTNLSESTLATASAKVFQTGDGQPLVGVVKINNKINYTIPNSDVRKINLNNLLIRDII